MGCGGDTSSVAEDLLWKGYESLYISNMYCKAFRIISIQMFTYVYDVLVPEVVIRLLMELHSIGYSEVSTILPVYSR